MTLSEDEWREHWTGPASGEEISRWEAAARYEMEYDYVRTHMSDIYPMSRGILRILSALRSRVAALTEENDDLRNLLQHFGDDDVPNGKCMFCPGYADHASWCPVGRINAILYAGKPPAVGEGEEMTDA